MPKRRILPDLPPRGPARTGYLITLGIVTLTLAAALAGGAVAAWWWWT